MAVQRPRVSHEPAVSPSPPLATSRRLQRRQQHQELSRTQLLDAAEEIFARKGYHETTLKEIAELAEFSVGSVYSFFDNKDDLFLSVFLRRGDEFMPALRELLASEGTPRQRLHRLVDFEVGFFRRHPHFGRLYLRTSSTTNPVPETRVDRALSDNFGEAMDLQAQLFADGQRAGEFRAGDPHVLARLFSGLVSAYQSVDPAVVREDPGDAERLPVEELHEIVAAAFAAR
jgi:TetR/AcrR family transcriptional regulator